MPLSLLSVKDVGCFQQQRAINAIGMQERRRVAHELFDPSFLHVAVPTMQLERPAGDLPGDLRGKDLGIDSQRRIPPDVFVIRQPARLVHIGACHIGHHAHLGKLRADAVVLDQWLSTLNAD